MSDVIAVELIKIQCWCGMPYSIPTNLHREAHNSADDPNRQAVTVYCPLGHAWTYNPSTEVKRLKDELARTRSQLDQAQARAAENYAKWDKAARTLRRVAKGTCPECKRHFVNVARHMKSKHKAQT